MISDLNTFIIKDIDFYIITLVKLNKIREGHFIQMIDLFYIQFD
jgi:hypothetical protein